MQLLQSVEPSCFDPMLVIYYIAPSSAIAMTPMAFVDILDEDLRGVHLTAASIVEVVAVILGAGLFSFMLIYAEVRMAVSNGCGVSSIMIVSCYVRCKAFAMLRPRRTFIDVSRSWHGWRVVVFRRFL